MTELAQVVSRVLVLPCVTCDCALIDADSLEVRLWTRRHRHTVDFAGRAGCQSSSRTQTAARVTRSAGAGGSIGVETRGTCGQTAAVAGEEKET